MREILFRGFHPDEKGKEKVFVNGEWIKGHWAYGFYVHYDDVLDDHLDDCDYIVERHNGKDFVFKKVIPKTVCQYTGLTDKNVTKIFEGDILRGYTYPYCSDGQYNYFAKIVWFKNSPAFGLYTFKNPKSKVSGISSGISDYMEDFECDNWKIIGNIFENPELLEDQA